MQVSWCRTLAAAGLLAASAASAAAPADVDEARLKAADKEPGNWMSYGRTWSEQRYSPLDSINAGNASKLGLAWFHDLTAARGQEATPLVIDGIMYVVEAWDIVTAFDAATGKVLWRYDPKVPKKQLVRVCCDAVSRGIAAWKGKLYLGALDGRLIAIDAATGKEVWSVVTVDQTQPYAISMAPRVADGRVIIGNSGGEYGVRGYVSAYDSETGKLDWRFWTVPGAPDKPPEDPAMATALKTWTGEWWKHGGGGTVWDGVSYDPELGLVYFGTGNGADWPQKVRSPGGGDNLFLASIVAVHVKDGSYAWHYQATPGDIWDYDATQQLMQADLTIDGRQRKVLMQANKNGFFYVIDRATGELISARNFVPTTWATGVDPKTGRPVETPDARFDKTGKLTVIAPGPTGAHAWQPMSFNPATGLVYMPVQETAFPYELEKNYKANPIGIKLGIELA
ncbi:MAG TPA: PQQ-dependent dehydrogenase, methanol/ethanol family, partial [Stellaceae bacterium]|nr:PQQ-dependent dehydrogenase, methanol/ethanol family [Stellaceae bacterium]